MAWWNVPPFFDPLFRTNSGTGGKLPDNTVINSEVGAGGFREIDLPIKFHSEDGPAVF